MSYKCETCGDVFATGLESKNHLQSRHHSKNIKRQRSKNRQIFVAGFLPGIKDVELCDYFSNYGKVKAARVDKKKGTFAFVEFVSESDANNALKLVHILGGRRLIVKNCVTSAAQRLATDTGVNHPDVVSSLQLCSTISEQINTFCAKLSLSQADVDNRNSVCRDIEFTLQKFYPECKIHIFGSTANGFGTKGCDLDLLFEPSPSFWDFIAREANEKKNATKFSVSAVELGKVPYEEFLCQPSYIHVQFLAKVFQKRSYIYQHPVYVPARCPIVKFSHKEFQQQCDISCSNRLVVCNTELLCFFGKLDNRVTPLMMLLRYWAKFRGLIRIGNLSSYAFSLMVIFFLQNTKPSVLPSVMYLRSKADKERIEAGWDCSFCTDVSKVEPSTNSESIENLVLAFLKYFADYDFSYVVSPLTGKAESRNCFYDLTNEEEQNFKSSPICIQDPLECSRNVTAFLKVQVLLLLKETMKKAAAVFEAKITAIKAGPSWGVLSLLQESKSIQRPLSIILSENVLPMPKNGLMFTLEFSNELKDCLTDVHNNNGMWLNKISSAIVNIFGHALSFEAEVIDQYDILPVLRKSTKRSANDDVSSISKVVCQDKAVNLDLNIGYNSDCDKLDDGTDNHLKVNSDEDSHEKCVDQVSSNKCGHISLQSDETEMENNAGDKPAQSVTSFPESSIPQILISVQSIVHYNVWTGRKKYKEKMLESHTLDHNYLDSEHALSLYISNTTTKLSKEIFFTCDCYMYRGNAHDRLLFVLTPFNCAEDFKPLSYFLKYYIPNVLNEMILQLWC